MDAFVLLFTLAILLALGMPVAFAVGLSAVAGALWIDLPLEALMIQTFGVTDVVLRIDTAHAGSSTCTV